MLSATNPIPLAGTGFAGSAAIESDRCIDLVIRMPPGTMRSFSVGGLDVRVQTSALGGLAEADAYQTDATGFAAIDAEAPFVEGMPVRTVGLRSDPLRCFTSGDVRPLCDRFKMVRVEAVADSTEVVDDESGRDRPSEYFISDTVDSAGRSVHLNLSVPVRADATRPKPALAIHSSVLQEASDEVARAGVLVRHIGDSLADNNARALLRLLAEP